ncbi:MAG TPA: dihydrodipicolinate synthase family protein [Bryobacteraceae bacterium]|nr:dihydrodipicolinate synthase family protein [Bryobacteraceae bacterium]
MKNQLRNNGSHNCRLEGVVVPMVTPLTASGDVDGAGLDRLTEFLIAGGVHGLFALGSTGEFVSLTWEKQRQVLERLVRRAGKRVTVYAGVSSNCLDEIVSRAAEAAEIGADVAVVLPPCYYRLSQAELIRFYSYVADRSPLPVVMYNMPFRTNNNIEPATVDALSTHPRIVGIKDTVGDMARTLEILGRVRERDDFAYLHGNELLSLPAILYGARGLVPAIANFEPADLVAAYEAARRRDLANLPRWQARIQGLMRVFGLLESRPQDSTTLRLKAIKAVLEIMGICESHMAQLDEPADSEQMEKIRQFAAAEKLVRAG